MDQRAMPATGAPGAGGSRWSRSILVTAAAIAALIAIALIVGLTRPDRPAAYPAGSPESAFQEYFRAWESRDLDAAYARLSSDVRSELTLAEYRRMDADMTWVRDQDRRVVLLDATVTGDRAVLDLRIDEFTAGGLGGQRSSYERAVSLVREGGGWYVDQALLGIEVVGYPGKY